MANFWNGPRCTATYYGTPREPVERALAEGRDVLFDIDWQGARQLKEKMPRGRHQRLRPAALRVRIEISTRTAGRGFRGRH